MNTMSGTEFDQIVEAAVAKKRGDGQIVDKQWLAVEIVKRQGKITGDSAAVAFYTHGALKHTGAIIDSIIRRKFKSDAEPESRQMMFEGYEHLHVDYSIVRDGRPMIVPLVLTTHSERMQIADRLDIMADGCRAHAKEMHAYDRSITKSA